MSSTYCISNLAWLHNSRTSLGILVNSNNLSSGPSNYMVRSWSHSSTYDKRLNLQWLLRIFVMKWPLLVNSTLDRVRISLVVTNLACNIPFTPVGYKNTLWSSWAAALAVTSIGVAWLGFCRIALAKVLEFRLPS